jgi:hypothetical protein
MLGQVNGINGYCVTVFFCECVDEQNYVYGLPVGDGHFHLGRDNMANVGTRNDSVLAWTMGSLNVWAFCNEKRAFRCYIMIRKQKNICI